jgi:hypothetical protein
MGQPDERSMMHVPQQGRCTYIRLNGDRNTILEDLGDLLSLFVFPATIAVPDLVITVMVLTFCPSQAPIHQAATTGEIYDYWLWVIDSPYSSSMVFDQPSQLVHELSTAFSIVGLAWPAQVAR